MNNKFNLECSNTKIAENSEFERENVEIMIEDVGIVANASVTFYMEFGDDDIVYDIYIGTQGGLRKFQANARDIAKFFEWKCNPSNSDTYIVFSDIDTAEVIWWSAITGVKFRESEDK